MYTSELHPRSAAQSLRFVLQARSACAISGQTLPAQNARCVGSKHALLLQAGAGKERHCRRGACLMFGQGREANALDMCCGAAVVLAPGGVSALSAQSG